MCRMVAVVSAQPVPLRALLADAPRSLCALSRQHRDGWGIAWTSAGEWTVRKGVACAAECGEFTSAASQVRSRLAVAHVRQKTVGPTSLVNTHPFRRGRWVLAHNGTVENVPAVTTRCSRERLAEIEGDTDSERLFAFLMTSIDAAGDVARGLVHAVRELRALLRVGAASFLLSDGETLYAHRLGRSLFVLDRTRGPGRRTPSLAIASERLTDEAWAEVDEGALMAINAGESPRIALLAT